MFLNQEMSHIILKQIIINDEYVELRKALAEGKTLQLNEAKKFDDNTKGWKDLTINDRLLGDSKHLFPVDYYRIKPEEKIESESLNIINEIISLDDFNSVIKWDELNNELCWLISDKKMKKIATCKYSAKLNKFYIISDNLNFELCNFLNFQTSLNTILKEFI
mgnify:CR=1 FL=1